MGDRRLQLPRAVRLKAAARGAEGRAWLSGLPGLIDEVEREWGLQTGATLHGGTEALVVESVTDAGVRSVLKLAMPGAGVAAEAACLQRADGRGYVRLLRFDADRRALLQERLGVQLAELGWPVRAQIEVICATLRNAWGASADAALQTGAEKAHELRDDIAETWRDLDQPCSERVIAMALTFAASRQAAFDPAAAVLVHGDAHAWNTLCAEDESGFKLIDPDGLFAEPACDLAVPMREWSRELLDAVDAVAAARARAALLSDLTGVGVQAIWEWGYIERVSTGLLCLRVGMEEVGSEMLAVAEALAAP